MKKVELHLSPMGDESRVLVDGVDIADGLRGVTVQAGSGQFTRVTLDLVLLDVTSIDGEVEMLIPDGTRDTLVQLGWKPPSQAH